MDSTHNNITKEDILQIPGMENLPEEELKSIVESVKEFALILQLIPSTGNAIQK